MYRLALRPAALLLAPALLLTACGGSGSGSAEDTGKSAAAGYPLTLDNCGHKVTLKSPPKRAVSLNQGTTEILLSLGLADRVAGTATLTDPVMKGLEKANASVPRLADNAPSFEKVLDAEPDFVTASFVSTLGEGGPAEVLTPALIEQVYGVRTEVTDDPGHPVIRFLRPAGPVGRC